MLTYHTAAVRHLFTSKYHTWNETFIQLVNISSNNFNKFNEIKWNQGSNQIDLIFKE